MARRLKVEAHETRKRQGLPPDTVILQEVPRAIDAGELTDLQHLVGDRLRLVQRPADHDRSSSGEQPGPHTTPLSERRGSGTND